MARVKERVRLQVEQEFEVKFNDWRKKIFPQLKKQDFSKFWFPISIVSIADLSKWFTAAQHSLSDIFSEPK